MVDAKELRIGNLVHYTYQRSTPDEWVRDEVTISGIHQNGFQFKKTTGNHSLIIDLDQFSPIPITPEWLERLGFEYISDDQLNSYTKTLGGRVTISLVEIIGDGWATLVELNIGLGFGSINQNPPESVHQLQNLCFALTGEELTLKPE